MSHFVRIAGALLIALWVSSCAEPGRDGVANLSQHELLAQLDAQRLAWSHVGAKDYSFSIHTECDCPDEAKHASHIVVGGASASKPSSAKLPITAVTSAQSMEAFFADLRQAVIKKAVSNIDYDPTYGFPTRVQLSKAAAQTTPDAIIYADNFKLQSQKTVLSVNELVGMWVSNADNLATGNIGWLIDDGGQWNQLQASGSARTELTALPIGSRLRVIGNWVGDLSPNPRNFPK